MPSVLGDGTSGSKGDGAREGNASPPREGETAGTGLHRPVAGLDEVSKDEAEASSLVASPQGIEFEATRHHAEGAGCSGSIPSSLHLGRSLSSFAFPLVVKLSYFTGTCFLFFPGLDGGPWKD